MDKDDSMFELDALKTFANLYNIANADYDGADKMFDYVEKVENCESKPKLRILKKSTVNGNDNPKENKHNFSPDDQFDDQNINLLAHKLICSVKRSRTSKLHNRHSITVDGIEIELPLIKHHAMVTRLDELESTPKLDLRARSVVKSEYKYEHIKSGSKVFKSRCLFPYDSESSISSNNNNIIKDKSIYGSNENKEISNNQNINVPTSSIKAANKPQKKRVLNSQGGVQVVENKDLAHDGIRVLEKRLNTIPKPLSFESRKPCTIKPQCMNETEQQWLFKARPATVLKKKPFVPKHEKKYTEPINIRLNTERRAQEWIIFELELKKKISQYEENTRMRQEEMKKKEMDLIKIMRQKTVHKPQPIKKYKPVIIKKSGRPITVPRSPKFSIRPIRKCLNHNM